VILGRCQTAVCPCHRWAIMPGGSTRSPATIGYAVVRLPATSRCSRRRRGVAAVEPHLSTGRPARADPAVEMDQARADFRHYYKQTIFEPVEAFLAASPADPLAGNAMPLRRAVPAVEVRPSAGLGRARLCSAWAPRKGCYAGWTRRRTRADPPTDRPVDPHRSEPTVPPQGVAMRATGPPMSRTSPSSGGSPSSSTPPTLTELRARFILTVGNEQTRPTSGRVRGRWLRTSAGSASGCAQAGRLVGALWCAGRPVAGCRRVSRRRGGGTDREGGQRRVPRPAQRVGNAACGADLVRVRRRPAIVAGTPSGWGFRSTRGSTSD
jgi:hypothetical protein